MCIAMPRLEMFTQEFWDERYRGHEHVWSGRPNLPLVREAGELPAGRALDVGCGEGADAIWLAARGWTVTGTDISPVGLDRAAANAAAAGPEIARRISWRQGDLFGDDWPQFSDYTLVSSHYLHLPPDARAPAIARLAAAVAPGGDLLIAAHHPSDLAIPGLRPNLPELFCTPDELAALLDDADWQIITAEAPERTAPGPGPEHEPVVVRDTVLRARRRAG